MAEIFEFDPLDCFIEYVDEFQRQKFGVVDPFGHFIELDEKEYEILRLYYTYKSLTREQRIEAIQLLRATFSDDADMLKLVDTLEELLDTIDESDPLF